VDSPVENEHTKLIRELGMLNRNERWKKSPTRTKPFEFGNRLIHVDSLIEMIKSSAVCKLCVGDLQMKENKIGIATKLEHCCEKCKKRNETATFHSRDSANSMKYHAVDSFSINFLFVLALHQMGGGATESGILLTYLGLPLCKNFSENSFRANRAKNPSDNQKCKPISNKYIT